MRLILTGWEKFVQVWNQRGTMRGLTVRRRTALGGAAGLSCGAGRPVRTSAAEIHAPFRAALLAVLAETGGRCASPTSADVSAPECTALTVAGVNPAVWIRSTAIGRLMWALICAASAGACLRRLTLRRRSAGGWVSEFMLPEAQAVFQHRRRCGGRMGLRRCWRGSTRSFQLQFMSGFEGRLMRCLGRG